MGQYYRPLIISKNGDKVTLNAHEYDNGIKLMEHSYLGNNFVNAVASLLWQEPKKVAWIGDYSADYMKLGDAYEKKIGVREFLKMYKAVWGENGCAEVHPSEEERNMESPGLYLVNHTMRVYLDLDAYRKQNEWTETGCWENGEYKADATFKMCANPLPLLTACGNGRGGGDYYEDRPDYEEVGTWAFDEIEITPDKPENFVSVMFGFSEKRKVEVSA